MSLHNQNGDCQQSYNISVPNQYYGRQIPALHIDPVQTQQSMFLQQPRSAHSGRSQRSSSSASLHTPRTTPHARDFDRMNYRQTNLSPLDNGIGSYMPRDFDLLDPQYVRPYHGPTAGRGPEQAWSPYNMRLSQSGSSHGLSPRSNVNFQFPWGPGSDVDSQALPSDEGYVSRNTKSVISNDPDHLHQELSASIMSDINNMHVESATSEAPTMSRMPSDQRSHVSSRSGRSRSKKDFPCYECSEVLKCNSEFKKHMLKHSKPFKCDVPGCKRVEGFTTTNDLERHQKSLHRKDIDKKSYQCAVEDCRNKEKIWPRLDNFKQHVERMHKDENVLDLVERSVWRPRRVDSPIEGKPTVTPLDIGSTVAGMEIPFSISPTMGNMSMMDFPMMQDARYLSSPSQDSVFVPKTQPLSRPSGPGFTSAPHNSRVQKVPKMTRSRHNAPGIQDSLTSIKAAPGASGINHLTIQKSSQGSSLSNAPQTKAEQQALELKRKSEQRLHSPEPVDIESRILELLQKANRDDRSRRPSKSEKNDALLKMMAELVNKGPGSPDTEQRRSSKSSSNNDKLCPMSGCEFAVARDCDLRKHIKRHNRPYGCTYPKCHKRFGAKSDWKRHENSQHFQQEAFRCGQELQTGQVCGVHLYREGAFKNHLEMQHKMTCELAQERVNARRIGKNCQGTFWCGLCKDIVQLKERRNAAWDERFDHIARHFEKERRVIDDWICAEENRPKKELLEEKKKRDYFDGEDERDKDGDVDATGDVDDDIPQPRPPHHPPPNNMPSVPISDHATMQHSPVAGDIALGTAVKRQRSEDSVYGERHSKRRQTTTVMNRYCCACQNPCGVVDVACANCSHRVCAYCSVEETEAFMDFFCGD